MNIILNFSDDTKTSNTITELIRLNNDQLNIDNVIKTIYGKLNEIVAKTLDLIDRNICELELFLFYCEKTKKDRIPTKKEFCHVTNNIRSRI